LLLNRRFCVFWEPSGERFVGQPGGRAGPPWTPWRLASAAWGRAGRHGEWSVRAESSALGGIGFSAPLGPALPVPSYGSPSTAGPRRWITSGRCRGWTFHLGLDLGNSRFPASRRAPARGRRQPKSRGPLISIRRMASAWALASTGETRSPEPVRRGQGCPLEPALAAKCFGPCLGGPGSWSAGSGPAGTRWPGLRVRDVAVHRG